MVALSPVEERIVAAGFGHEMIGASHSCSPDVLADEPRVNIMLVQLDHDGIDVAVFTRVSTSEEAHDVGCVHLVMKERCEHGSGVDDRDSSLLLPEGIFVGHP